MQNFMLNATQANRLADLLTDDDTADNVILQVQENTLIIRRQSWGGITVTLEVQELP